MIRSLVGRLAAVTLLAPVVSFAQLALALGREGYRVGVCGRTPGPLEAVVEELRAVAPAKPRRYKLPPFGFLI